MMRATRVRRSMVVIFLGVAVATLTGCGTVGSVASDLGLAGAGGVAGYELSDGSVRGAAAGATIGYLASRVTQSEVRRAIGDAEQRGYERALNQAVKQQYWIIQNQQKSDASVDDGETLVPIVIPETTVEGVTYQAHVEYVRVER